MGTVIEIVLACVFFLMALRCLFTKVQNDSPAQNPDLLDRVGYELILRRPPPPPGSTGPKNLLMVRVLGFLLFTGWGVWLIAR